jgi:peptidoglycan hydrolase-like protein with peptidoglycan-binding domain
MLNSIGYDCGTADGIFGNKTVNAVKALQTAEGLTVDGIAGQKTLETLAARAAVPDEPDEPTGDAVAVSVKEIDDVITQLEALREQLDGLAYIARGWID